MKKIYAILPCYNEEENIGKLIEEWNKQLKLLKEKEYELSIIAIDDCSIDNTKNIILENKEKYSNVDIIEHKQNQGLRGGLNTALHYFSNNAKEGDLLVLMDGDNTHDPKYVHRMLELILQGNDCVIASRYQEDSNIVGLAKTRELMSDFAKLYYSAILRIPNVKDYTCGYRIYTYNIIQKLLNKFGENPIKEKSFACMMELLYKVYLVGAKFGEVGFELRYDKKCGNSKMKVLKTAERSLVTALKLKLRYNFLSLLTIIFLIIFSIFLSLGTNFSQINHNILSHDCGIFSYIAFAMQKGRVLYKETWDNKGPLLYFIYYIGFLINSKYGVYLLELISIFISVLFGYKTIKLITDKKLYSIIGIIYTFSVWGVTFEGGTFSESFALPLMFIGIYLFTKKIFKGQKLKNLEIVILGILTALIASLRLNMLAIFLALFIVIGIDLIFEKQFKEILRWLAYGVLGFIIAIIPILIYLIYNKALVDCMNTAYFGILSGFNCGTIINKIRVLISMIITFNISGGSILILGFIITSILLIINKNITNKNYKKYIMCIILAIVINLYANSVAGAYQMHYLLTFIPILAMAISLAIKLYDTIKLYYWKKIILLVIVVLSLSYTGYKDYIFYCGKRTEKVSENSLNAMIQQYIEDETNEEDLVQMIGGRMESVGANFITKRLSASKYSYLPLWPSFTKERKSIMTNELIIELKEKEPELIMICQYNNNEKEFHELIEDKESWNEFLEENYIKDNESIKYYTIYKRK